MTSDVPLSWKIKRALEQVDSSEKALAVAREHFPAGVVKAEARLRTDRAILTDYQAQKMEAGLQGRGSIND